jgi:uncharacterized SAM-binding protein YcdF (DUF218 family)
MTLPYAAMTYDAIIVLANEMDSNGILNTESALRANLAAKLMSELRVPYIVTCGWAYRKDSSILIANAFKSYLIEVGVRSDSIIADIHSRDTVGDAIFTRINVAEPMGFHNLCVVTSNYHVSRTSKIFDFVYGPDFNIDVRGANVDYSEAVVAKELESEWAFKKTFENVEAGDIGRIVDALRVRHPFYNGEIYSKI